MKHVSKFLVLFVFLFVGSAFVLADNNVVESGSSITGMLDMGMAYSDPVQNVLYKLCPETELKNKKGIISYSLRPGQSDSICVNFGLKNNLSKVLQYSFVKGNMTSNKTITCSNDISTGDAMFFPYYESKDYLISGQIERIKNRIYVPVNATGTKYFCLVYYIKKSPEEEQHALNGMFTLLIRKGLPFEVKIGGEVYKYKRIDDLKFFYQDNKLYIAWGFVVFFAILLIYNIMKSFYYKK